MRRRHGAWLPLGYLLAGRTRRRIWSVARASRLRRALAGSQLRLPDEDLARHVLVTGLTGAGKTAAVTIPVLLEAAHRGISVVAFDLKHGEDDSLARAAPAWQRGGRDVWSFAPLDRGSLVWNPLAGCRSIAAAMRVAAMLFDDAGREDPDGAYWVGAERQVCAILALAVATDGGGGTLGRVRTLCEAGPEAVRSYMHKHPAARELDCHLGAFRAMLPKDEAGILQGIAARLEAWSDDAVRRSTGIGEPDECIDLARLRREPLLLLIGIPQEALGRLRWLWQLFVKDLTSRLLRPRERSESVGVLEVLEELPAWGLLPGLADQLATLRSRQVSVLATIQSEAQGEMVYGRAGWAAIAANLVTKIYIPPLADLDAERLSRALGTRAVHDISLSRSWGDRGSYGAEHHRDATAPLRRPEQLQGIDAEDDEILLRCPRQPPARLWCPPHHLRPEYSGLVPPRPPTAGEIAVCHRLWTKRTRSVDGVRAGTCDLRTPSVGGESPAQRPRSSCPPRPPEGLKHDRPVDPPPPAGSFEAPADFAPAPLSGIPSRGPEGADAARRPDSRPDEDELAILRRFVESLVTRACNGPECPVRMVLRAGRLIELRVEPATAAALCGGPDAMQVLIRRWVELRWVRRVRPVLVLERRAIEAATALPHGVKAKAPH